MIFVFVVFMWVCNFGVGNLKWKFIIFGFSFFISV